MPEKDGGRQIATDGKAVRRTFSRTALHLAGAFAPDSGLMLGQAEVDGKSNEIRALPLLLDMMDLRERSPPRTRCARSARRRRRPSARAGISSCR